MFLRLQIVYLCFALALATDSQSEEDASVVTTTTTEPPPPKCSVMEKFNCARACRGVMRTSCEKQENTYICGCMNGDIYSNQGRPDGQLFFQSNSFGKTTRAPYPFYIEPMHMQTRARFASYDPCDPSAGGSFYV